MLALTHTASNALTATTPTNFLAARHNAHAPRQPQPIAAANIKDLPGAAQETQGQVFDPLNLADLCPYGSENFEWMRTAEIKHGRICMAASVGWLLTEAGVHFPGYLSKSEGVTFESLGTSGMGAWALVPEAGKYQIFATIAALELINESRKPHYMKAGMPTFEKKGRLAELKNGRLAMIAVASFYAGTVLPGSVPLLPASWH